MLGNGILWTAEDKSYGKVIVKDYAGNITEKTYYNYY